MCILMNTVLKEEGKTRLQAGGKRPMVRSSYADGQAHLSPQHEG
jgi:hypothetical protein